MCMDNTEVRDEMAKSEFSLKLNCLFQNQELENYLLDDDFYVFLLDMLNKFSKVKPYLKMEAYEDLFVCSYNALVSLDISDGPKNNQIVGFCLEILRTGSDVADGIDGLKRLVSKCNNLFETLLRVL